MGISLGLGTALGFGNAAAAAPSGATYINMPGAAGDYLSTPDAAPIDITADLDIQWYGALSDWTPGSVSALVSKYNTGGGQRSYMLAVESSGALRLYWSTNGTATLTKTSSAATGLSDGVLHWVRVTLDVDNGGGDADVRFYLGGATATPSWVQLGTTQTVGATTAIHSGSAPLNLGCYNNGTGFVAVAHELYRATVKSGIGGTTVFDAIAADCVPGASTFIEAGSGATVTINGNAEAI